MDKKMVVSPSPHIFTTRSTTRIMGDVLIALVPAFAVSVWVFGIDALIVTAVSVACCVAFEWLIQRFLIKGPSTVGNLSAVVTGVLLAFNLPSILPLWMVALGAFVAIGIGKMTFGGLGKNPFNPALVGRVFLLIAYPSKMAGPDAFPPVDGVSGATPLDFVKQALASGQPVSEILPQIDFMDLAVGLKSGSFGEVAAIALLIGGVYLLIRRVITWHIPVGVLGSMAIFSGILWFVQPEAYMSPLFHLLTGGAMLGAIYMATDYSSSPMTKKGGVMYAAGIGLLTIVIRLWGSYPEGMSFAILIMNALVPLINKYVKPSRFGAVKTGRA